MAVAFDEDDKSPHGGYEGSQYIIERTGKTIWTAKDAFVLELMPPSQVIGVGGGQFYGAAFPSDPRFRVAAFKWQPFGAQIGVDAAGLPLYELASWNIRYQVPTFPATKEDDPVPFLEHEWDLGGEFLTIPEIGVSWTPPQSNGNQKPAVGVQAGFFLPTAEIGVTFDQVVSPPWDAIRTKRGKVNSAAFKTNTGTAYAETMLFLGGKLKRSIMSDGERAWKLIYKFSEKTVPARDQTDPGGWNHFFRKAMKINGTSYSAGFYRAYRVCKNPPDDGKIYQTTTFDELFKGGTTE